MTTRLLLVRHAQTDWNADGRFMGQRDIELSAIGLRQAEAVGRRLARERPQAIYTSDLKRAWQTAEQIHRAIAVSCAPDQPPALLAEPALREMSFGAWEGLNYQQITTEHPEELQAWKTDYLNYAPPGGENALQMLERVFSAHMQIAERHPEASVILIAHGGTLQALLARLLDLPIERMWQLHISNTGVSEVELHPAGAILNLFNDTCHLEGVR